ncbi:SCO1664 family protein [Blastococcus sp. Marseille-P5729]|uniref:SCO1664 family protein n=1 Tax=Blastococcus sp. Marseille-P5729 TaxID=2086582 RepID=UPI001F23B595|nr:SCO1664 family protein [Blastococcus sp. Marseille-P5729]
MSADLELLRTGEIEVVGRILDASNSTLLCSITGNDERSERCVYKPVLGERPLWDYPDGTLAGRELASYAVSEATGWGIIPPTVLRDGPFGPGMVQLWMERDEEVDLVDLINSRPAALRRMAVLDAVINNSDRKGGHLIPHPAPAGTPLREREVWGVDHGVTFSVEDKLRTLLWQWAGQPLTADAIGVLERLREQLDGELGDQLHEHLTVAEVRQTATRVERLLRSGRHPLPSDDWPSVPYPPF